MPLTCNVPLQKDYPSLIEKCADMLRPGGVFLMVDATLQLFRPDKSPADIEHSWTQRVFFHGAPESNISSPYFSTEDDLVQRIMSSKLGEVESTRAYSCKSKLTAPTPTLSPAEHMQPPQMARRMPKSEKYKISETLYSHRSMDTR
jgi:hypothetical protein